MPLLLVDLDNTVADRDAAFGHWVTTSLAAWAPADGVAAQAFLVEHDRDGFRPRLEFLSDVREHFGLTACVDELLADYRRLTLAGFPCIDTSVADRLRTMREEGWKLGVVTNGESGVQEATVEKVGLAPLLDACVVSGTVGIRKPDPRIFEMAAERCGLPTVGGWMIGDAHADVIGADAAGLRSIWLTRGRRWLRDDVKPDLVADSFIAALDALVPDGRDDQSAATSTQAL